MKDLLLAALMYSVFGVDHIAAGQLMISRPLVLGSFFGWLYQWRQLGLTIGATIEFLWMQVIPAGGIWPIDTTVIAGLCLYWSRDARLPGGAILALGLVLAIPCGIISRHIDIWLRQVNNRFSDAVIQGFEAGRESVLRRVMGMVLAMWFLKSFVFFIVMAGVGEWILKGFMYHYSPALVRGFDFAGQALLVVALGATFNFFLNRMMGTLMGFGRRARALLPGMKDWHV